MKKYLPGILSFFGAAIMCFTLIKSIGLVSAVLFMIGFTFFISGLAIKIDNKLRNK